MKKLLIALTLMAAILSNVAFAQSDWYVVKVRIIGKDGDSIYMRANHVHSEPKFTNVMFKFDANLQTEGLAIAMAAISTGNLVTIKSDVANSEPGIHPRVMAVYLYDSTVTSQ